MPTKTVLSDEALREIETIMDGDDFGAKYVTASIDNVMALCATVRAAWKERDDALVRASEDQDYDSAQRATLANENTALRDQLAEARTWIDRKNAAIETWQQQARELKSQLAQVTAERDDYKERCYRINKGLEL